MTVSPAVLPWATSPEMSTQSAVPPEMESAPTRPCESSMVAPPSGLRLSSTRTVK